jgi:hypothetical protein
MNHQGKTPMTQESTPSLDQVDLGYLTILWRTWTTRDPRIGDVWVSRSDPATKVKIISIRDGAITAIWQEGVKPPSDRFVQQASVFICFWKPAR